MFLVMIAVIDERGVERFYDETHNIEILPDVDDLMIFDGKTYTVTDLYTLDDVAVIVVRETGDIPAPTFPDAWR